MEKAADRVYAGSWRRNELSALPSMIGRARICASDTGHEFPSIEYGISRFEEFALAPLVGFTKGAQCFAPTLNPFVPRPSYCMNGPALMGLFGSECSCD